MGLRDLFSGLFGGGGRGVDELAVRLGVPADRLRTHPPSYTEFFIAKTGGGQRRIAAPDPATKALQKLILTRLLRPRRSHPAATGFERGHSIVTNAVRHAGRAVVVRLDVRDFFGTTKADRVTALFRKLGWNREAAGLLTRLCTRNGALPQGAPTSPKLANLVNYRLDCRLEALGKRRQGSYTRYADDLTFSFPADEPQLIHTVIGLTKTILTEEGYHLHLKKKLHLRRKHQRQIVTGLVVNQTVNLPRPTRRWLRAVEHHLKTGKPATLTPAQLAGWRALQRMVRTQRETGVAAPKSRPPRPAAGASPSIPAPPRAAPPPAKPVLSSDAPPATNPFQLD